MNPERRARFWAKVTVTPACWIWSAGRDAYGYGAFWDGQRVAKAHRISYLLVVGPIPDGLVIDHLCRNPECVNPDHLEPVTQGENVRRGQSRATLAALAAARERCLYGHKWSENTVIYGGKRECRSCNNARARRHRQRVRAA